MIHHRFRGGRKERLVQRLSSETNKFPQSKYRAGTERQVLRLSLRPQLNRSLPVYISPPCYPATDARPCSGNPLSA
jgi:hypothetical protein